MKFLTVLEEGQLRLAECSNRSGADTGLNDPHSLDNFLMCTLQPRIAWLKPVAGFYEALPEDSIYTKDTLDMVYEYRDLSALAEQIEHFLSELRKS